VQLRRFDAGCDVENMLAPGVATTLVGVEHFLRLALRGRIDQRNRYLVAGRDVERRLPLIDEPLAARHGVVATGREAAGKTARHRQQQTLVVLPSLVGDPVEVTVVLADRRVQQTEFAALIE